jgi:hypothetical protein
VQGAQLLTRRALDENRDRLEQTIGRLELRIHNGDPSNDYERLQKDLDISKQCLELCRMVTDNKVSELPPITQSFGEVVAQNRTQVLVETFADRSDVRTSEGSSVIAAYNGSRQTVVNTLADLFGVEKAVANNNSRMLLGSMSEDVLSDMVNRHYSS